MSDTTPPPARPTRIVRHLLRGVVRDVLLLFGAAWLLVGGIILIAGLRELWSERAFRRAMVRTDAVVADRTLERASRDGNPATRYSVSYRFTTAAGQPAAGGNDVDVEEWERLPPGTRVPIVYHPERPAEARLGGPGVPETPLVMFIIGGVFALIGGVLFGRAAYRTAREYRLLSRGTLVRATVVEVAPTSTSVNRVAQWQVRYRYRDAAGAEHEGSSGILPPARAQAFAPGAPVTVCYDARHPERSVWVEET